MRLPSEQFVVVGPDRLRAFEPSFHPTTFRRDRHGADVFLINGPIQHRLDVIEMTGNGVFRTSGVTHFLLMLGKRSFDPDVVSFRSIEFDEA